MTLEQSGGELCVDWMGSVCANRSCSCVPGQSAIVLKGSENTVEKHYRY